jgi:hypothetical protein
MRKLTALLTLATAVGLVSMFSTPVAAQSKDTISIADNDSVYIDGKSFSIVPGKAKGDISSQVKMLDAHDLGPGAIVFRTGDKLWIVNAVPVVRGMSDRYGSDRRDYGSDRYGSDRDTSVSAAQAERDWQDYLRGNRRYGSDRDTSVSAAQAERDWRDYLRGNPRYGSDRDTSVSAAQAERDWQDYLRGNPRYGSDRDTSVSAAQAERDWQDYLRGNRRYGSDRRDYGSDRYGSDPTTQPVYIADPEYVQYRLRKAFEDNWTAAAPIQR